MTFASVRTLTILLVLAACTACPSTEHQGSVDRRPAPATATARDATVPRQHVGDPLPVNLGATWTYDVVIHAGDSEQKLRWTTEVVDAYEGEGIRAYRIKGWPDQLADFDLLGADHAVAPAKLVTLVRSFDNYLWSDQPAATLEGAHLWFTWPIVDGQRICDDPGSRYCWQVAVEKGRYELQMRTNPDDTTYELTPGIGLTHYTYHHHGTRLDVDAKLVEHHP